jgi:hypothetical protein
MREIRQYGSEGREPGINRASLPLSGYFEFSHSLGRMPPEFVKWG